MHSVLRDAEQVVSDANLKLSGLFTITMIVLPSAWEAGDAKFWRLGIRNQRARTCRMSRQRKVLEIPVGKPMLLLLIRPVARKLVCLLDSRDVSALARMMCATIPLLTLPLQATITMVMMASISAMTSRYKRCWSHY